MDDNNFNPIENNKEVASHTSYNQSDAHIDQLIKNEFINTYATKGEIYEKKNNAEKADYSQGKTGINSSLNSYGKFKNADELLKAYQQLESEFTRKSQQLKGFLTKDKNAKANDLKIAEKSDNTLQPNSNSDKTITSKSMINATQLTDTKHIDNASAHKAIPMDKAISAPLDKAENKIKKMDDIGLIEDKIYNSSQANTAKSISQDNKIYTNTKNTATQNTNLDKAIVNNLENKKDNSPQENTTANDLDKVTTSHEVKTQEDKAETCPQESKTNANPQEDKATNSPLDKAANIKDKKAENNNEDKSDNSSQKNSQEKTETSDLDKANLKQKIQDNSPQENTATNDLDKVTTSHEVKTQEDKAETCPQEDKATINTQQENTPFYEREDWINNVKDFIKEKPHAKGLFPEIAREILKDKNIQQDKNCLEIGYLRALEKHYRPIKDVMSDNKLIDEYISNNSHIKQSIIDEYLGSVSNNSLPPSLKNKGRIAITPPYKPRTLEEAGAELIKKIIN